VRVIYIDPDARTIEYREIGRDFSEIQKLVGGCAEGHWIVRANVDGHDAYVDEEALLKKRTVWFFKGGHIWGPMVIFRMNATGGKRDTNYPLESLSDYVSFDTPDWLA
jgi:hypothetical protein